MLTWIPRFFCKYFMGHSHDPCSFETECAYCGETIPAKDIGGGSSNRVKGV